MLMSEDALSTLHIINLTSYILHSSRPVDLGLIHDSFDPVQSQQNLLSHLRLKKGSDGAFDADVAVLGFDSQLAIG